MTHRTIIIPILLFSFSCSSPKEEGTKESSTTESSNNNDEDIESGKLVESIGPAFKTLSLLQGQVQLEIPSPVNPMGEEMFRLKYPAENQQSTIAYSNEDGTVSLLISPRQDKATQADLPKYQQMLYESFGRNPSIDFKKSEIRKINGRDFIVLEMVTPAVDTEVYNLMFVTSLEGRLLMGTFNCTVGKLRDWQPLAEQTVSSVKVKD
jgi:hypothetical protein